jgi:hypothetical protein
VLLQAGQRLVQRVADVGGGLVEQVLPARLLAGRRILLVEVGFIGDLAGVGLASAPLKLIGDHLL